MLFNSYEFVLLFLPATVLLFSLATRLGSSDVALGVLVLASLVFYSWWEPAYLALILASVAINYGFSLALTRRRAAGRGRRLLLATAVAVNLGLLGYFKYRGFFLEVVNDVTAADLSVPRLVLPLAISFFTFQQISFLVDIHRGEATRQSPLHYFFYVTFFPQLIAGPIVLGRELFPQIARRDRPSLDAASAAMGLTLFALGLAKKVLVADGMGSIADPIFAQAASGPAPTLVVAWVGTIAYSFQIYFDFSGYSDMAVGLALLFNIRLPVNFASPYKAASVIEFWRRWHITLARFLKGYLYIPLGGNRRGEPRRMINVMIVMVLGGLWHGAGWTFVIWGAVHGGFIVVNRAWGSALRAFGLEPRLAANVPYRLLCVGLTFIAVSVAWVPFRAESLDAMWTMLGGLFGLNGVSLPRSLVPELGGLAPQLARHGIVFRGLFPGIFQGETWKTLVLPAVLALCWLAPNSQQIVGYVGPDGAPPPGAMAARARWRPSLAWSMAIGLLFGASVLSLHAVDAFIYFQF